MKSLRSSPFLPVAAVLQDFMTSCCLLLANAGPAKAVARAAKIRNLRMDISRLGPKVGATVYRLESSSPSTWAALDGAFFTRNGLFWRALIALILLISEPTLAQIYRCGNNFQALPCAEGQPARVVLEVVEVQKPGHATSAGTAAMFLCKRYNGRRFWTSRPCGQHNASLLEREVRVPLGLKWKEKLAYATRERRKAEALQGTLIRESGRPAKLQK